MIIQHAVKGIAGLSRDQVRDKLESGILCNLVMNRGAVSFSDIPRLLTRRNLDWHQNQYLTPDPTDPANEPFHLHTPFVSLTAGTVERDAAWTRNIITPAWLQALYFATGWLNDPGWLFYCYVFVLGKPSVEHEAFAEELRELNVYPAYSPFQPEGEITAKISVPAVQISHAELWDPEEIGQTGALRPVEVMCNRRYCAPEKYHNIRTVLE